VISSTGDGTLHFFQESLLTLYEHLYTIHTHRSAIWQLIQFALAPDNFWLANGLSSHGLRQDSFVADCPGAPTTKPYVGSIQRKFNHANMI